VAGTAISAGLPNITGAMSGNYVDPSTYSNAGAFKDVGVSAANLQIGASCWLNTLTFDASKSNPIYGNSTTVQPDALTMRYIIKAFDGQTADSALINITQYANELAGKADRSLSNLTDAGKSFSFPSGTYVAINYNTQKVSYTAPADGYVTFMAQAAANGAYIVIDGSENKISPLAGIGVGMAVPGSPLRTWRPVRKGETVYIGSSSPYTTYLTNIDCRFYYASGEVPA
jgi:hypothetical protein